MINSNVDTGGLACTSAPGLDSGYPYGTTTPETDSPATLLDSTYRTQTRSFNATMYLMWKSSSANSIPVPLGSQTWAFSTAANCGRIVRFSQQLDSDYKRNTRTDWWFRSE